MSLRFRARFLLSLILATLASALMTCSPGSQNSYEVGVINLTSEELDNVGFTSPKVNAGFGLLRQGYDYKKTMGLYSAPLPTTGTLEWTAPSGHHKSVVTIASRSAPFDGILWLKIMLDNSVVAVPLTKKEYYDQNINP